MYIYNSVTQYFVNNVVILLDCETIPQHQCDFEHRKKCFTSCDNHLKPLAVRLQCILSPILAWHNKK